MFDFVGKKKYTMLLSGLIILAGIIAMIVRGGLNLDVQFRGGTRIEIEMENGDFDADKAGSVASDAIGKTIHGQKSSTLDANQDNKNVDFLVLTSSGKLSEEERDTVIEAIKGQFSIKEGGQMQVRDVDPSIGKELKNRGLLAVFVAAIMLLIYVWIRFNIMSGLLAGLTAIVALIHDIAVMVSVYAIFNIPVNESFIAAVLTILGYSINDTIVIYDRIRENSRFSRKDTIDGLVNKSITQSMSRTINTTVTTVLCVLTIFLFAVYNGIGSIQEFTFPLLIGIVAGTYSSIFIASPLWVALRQREANKKAGAKPAKA